MHDGVAGAVPVGAAVAAGGAFTADDLAAGRLRRLVLDDFAIHPLDATETGDI